MLGWVTEEKLKGEKLKSGKMKGAINKKIGFIGAGNMAEAIISGIIKSGILARNIFTSDINSARLKFISQKYGVKTLGGNPAVVKRADIIFLAVKPYQIEEVLREISDYAKQTQLIISIAAGIKTQKIEKYLKKVSVNRVMPNTPALIGEGTIAICRGRYATASDIKIAKKLLSSCGIVIDVIEKDMHSVTAVSGSGPAYIFYIAEIMRNTAEKLGIQKDVAKKLVHQTLLGASKMLILSDDEPENLRQKVTSKGGTTEAAFKVLMKEKFGKIFEKAIFAAMKKSKKMSR
ncbi:MAG: pyrroline-5-carboxylate reductase [Elusimicrobia bacterium CG06_land_8_20_14_3_00_38_11]|nr:MAG: pyrroline-5-carboxylate reductase [Elusimicrobia bacterium CG06_land_8_20_14_3_00_38_11]